MIDTTMRVVHEGTNLNIIGIRYTPKGSAGQLRDRVTIQAPAEVDNDDGQPVPTWSDIVAYKMHAKVTYTGGAKTGRDEGEQDAVGDAIVLLRTRKPTSRDRTYQELICKFDA